MKIWVTKYALTKGIVLTSGTIEDSSATGRRMAKVKWKGGLNGTALFFGSDFHTSLDAARARTVEMIRKKRSSLQKQISNLMLLEGEFMNGAGEVKRNEAAQ